MTGGINGDIGSNLSIGTYPDFSDIENREIVICKEIFSYFNIISVIAVKRSFNVNILPGFSQDLFYKFIFFLNTVRCKVVVPEDFLFVFQPFFA